MTPEERNLVAELFDRLATLENAPRDPEAERLIRDGLRQAPNAAYALVQTVLVQDEALKRAEARIQRARRRPPADRAARRASSAACATACSAARLGLGAAASRAGRRVPSSRRRHVVGLANRRAGIRPAHARHAPVPAHGAAPAGARHARPRTAPGGSFLGTAAAAAAGVIGGSLLMGGIRSMMGGGHGARSRVRSGGRRQRGASPWSGGDSAAGGDLSRQAGLDDIGRDRPAATMRADRGGQTAATAMLDGSGGDG